MPKSAGLSIPRHSWGPAVFSPLSLLSPGAATYFVLLSSHQLRSGLYCQGLSWRNNSDLLQYWPEILACTYILKTAQNWKQSLAHPAPARADFPRALFKVSSLSDSLVACLLTQFITVSCTADSAGTKNQLFSTQRSLKDEHFGIFPQNTTVQHLQAPHLVSSHLPKAPGWLLLHQHTAVLLTTGGASSNRKGSYCLKKDILKSLRRPTTSSEWFHAYPFFKYAKPLAGFTPSIKPPGSPLFHGSIATRTAHHHHTITTISSFYLEAIGTLGWMSYIKLFTELKNTSPCRKCGTGGVGSRTVNIS